MCKKAGNPNTAGNRVLFRDIYILPSGIPAWNVSSKCIIKNKNK
jgi:hypothetical protein